MPVSLATACSSKFRKLTHFTQSESFQSQKTGFSKVPLSRKQSHLLKIQELRLCQMPLFSPANSGLSTYSILTYSRPEDFDRFEYDLDPNYPGHDDSFFSTDPQISLTFEGEATTTYRARARAIDKTGNESNWSGWSNNYTLETGIQDTIDFGEEFETFIGSLSDSNIYIVTDSNGNPTGLRLRDIDGNLINDATIPTGAIQTGAITEALIATGAITTPKIDTDAITAAKIATDAVTGDAIATDAVTAGSILAGSITTVKILAGAVEASKIAASAITTDKISANAITAVKIVANAITAAKIAAGAIETDKIQAGAIETNLLAANAVTAEKVDVDDLSAGIATVIELDADRIQTGELSAEHISGDVKNATVLWYSTNSNGKEMRHSNSGAGTSYTVPNFADYEFLEFIVAWESDDDVSSGEYNWDGGFIPTNFIGSSNPGDTDDNCVSVQGWNDARARFNVWSDDANTIRCRSRFGGDDNRIRVYQIIGASGPKGTGDSSAGDTSSDEVALSLPSVSNKTYTVGDVVNELLPAATGGTGSYTYSLTGLAVAGLSFSASTRRITGTVTTAHSGDSVTYSVNDGSNTDDSEFTITVNAVANVTRTETIYRRGTTTPSTPSGGTSTYNHTPSGWSYTDPGATSTQNVYQSQRTVTYTSTSYSSSTFVSATAWGSPSLHESMTGLDTNTATRTIYRRGTTTPSTPSGGTSTYNHTPSGWSYTDPGATSTQNVYQSQRTVTYTGDTLTSSSFQSATAWGSPSLHEEATGISGPSSVSASITGNQQDGFFVTGSWSAVSDAVDYNVSFSYSFGVSSSISGSLTTSGTSTSQSIPSNRTNPRNLSFSVQACDADDNCSSYVSA